MHGIQYYLLDLMLIQPTHRNAMAAKRLLYFPRLN